MLVIELEVLLFCMYDSTQYVLGILLMIMFLILEQESSQSNRR